MTFRITSTLMFIALLMQSISVAMAASLLSTVDQNRISINDTVSLTVKLDQQADANALDLTPLESSFDVLGVSPLNSSSVTINNGKTVQTTYTQWSITLAPKREGTLTIPALSVAGTRSQAISITVASSTSTSAANAPLDVLVMTSEVDAFVKQQIILTVELSTQVNVGNLDGSPLSIENAEIRNLGQTSSTRVDNGIARQVIQLKYALFPKRAGTINIPSLTFSGVQGGSRSFFGSRGKRVVARSKPLTLNIKEQPTSPHVWLPADSVQMRSELSGDASQYEVGAPITRRITIQALGQSAEAIPPVSTQSLNGVNPIPGTALAQSPAQAYKSYEDKPQLQTASSEQGLVGTRIESMAIVPSIAGELILPALALNWWDVKAQQWRQATVPEETIIVRASSSQQNAATHNGNHTSDGSALSVNQVNDSNKQYLWQALSALLFLICVLQFFLLKRRPVPPAENALETKNSDTERTAWKQLQQSLKQGDPVAIRRSAVHWASLITQNERPATLMSLAKQADSAALTLAFTKLEAQLYGRTNDALSAQEIETIQNSLNQLRQNASGLKGNGTGGKQTNLAPLYPQ